MSFEFVIDKVVDKLLKLVRFISGSTVVSMECAIVIEKYPAAKLISYHLCQSRVQAGWIANIYCPLFQW